MKNHCVNLTKRNNAHMMPKANLNYQSLTGYKSKINFVKEI